MKKHSMVQRFIVLLFFTFLFAWKQILQILLEMWYFFFMLPIMYFYFPRCMGKLFCRISQKPYRISSKMTFLQHSLSFMCTVTILSYLKSNNNQPNTEIHFLHIKINNAIKIYFVTNKNIFVIIQPCPQFT